VMSTSGPIGTPAARRSLATGLKNGTHEGTRVDLGGPAMMWTLLAQWGDETADDRTHSRLHLGAWVRMKVTPRLGAVLRADVVPPPPSSPARSAPAE
jgi:hypothetical protein